MKKMPEPIDINLSYEDAVPFLQDLAEFKALEDEGRRAAFAKFVKRQKVCGVLFKESLFLTLSRRR